MQTMNAELQCFDFDGNPVRVVDRDGLPWFVAADVCRVLDIANPRDAVSSLDEDEKTTVGNTDGRAGAGPQTFNVVSESGLYAMVFKSRKPQARLFRKWVTSVVLPTLRTEGRYELSVDEVDRLSVLDFIALQGRGWTLQRQIEFGLKVRAFAKAMGVAFEQKVDPCFGRVLAFPVPVFHRVAEGLRLQRGTEAYEPLTALLAMVDEAGLSPWEGSAVELEALLKERIGTRAVEFCKEHPVARVLGRAAQGGTRVESRRTRDARRWGILSAVSAA